jgi:ubiquinone biosynthesis monooxygenase Coq7
MGPKAAHACTEAVENVIEEHYAGQVAELADREPGLSAELAQFREEELAHRDRAVAEGAHEARGYALLTAVVRAGCRTAIKISEKV